MLRAPDPQRPMRVLKLLLATPLLAVAYLAWPMFTALQIREAIIAGDTATLERKVEWAAVRASLKESLSAETKARLEKDPNAPAPSLWQRIKASLAPSLAESARPRCCARSSSSFVLIVPAARTTIGASMRRLAPPFERSCTTISHPRPVLATDWARLSQNTVAP